MGFPFESATWDVVEGAMYMGAGGGFPGFYTLVAAVICIFVLWKGNAAEQERYQAVEK
ncbi:MAG: hypothetical protein P8M25_10175 [Paracoccaceae bacterium]|nr:hypothetical protein [Paracoccaceae bacterium]